MSKFIDNYNDDLASIIKNLLCSGKNLYKKFGGKFFFIEKKQKKNKKFGGNFVLKIVFIERWRNWVEIEPIELLLCLKFENSKNIPLISSIIQFQFKQLNNNYDINYNILLYWIHLVNW